MLALATSRQAWDSGSVVKTPFAWMVRGGAGHAAEESLEQRDSEAMVGLVVGRFVGDRVGDRVGDFVGLFVGLFVVCLCGLWLCGLWLCGLWLCLPQTCGYHTDIPNVIHVPHILLVQ